MDDRCFRLGPIGECGHEHVSIFDYVAVRDYGPAPRNEQARAQAVTAFNNRHQVAVSLNDCFPGLSVGCCWYGAGVVYCLHRLLGRL